MLCKMEDTHTLNSALKVTILDQLIMFALFSVCGYSIILKPAICAAMLVETFIASILSKFSI